MRSEEDEGGAKGEHEIKIEIRIGIGIRRMGLVYELEAGYSKFV